MSQHVKIGPPTSATSLVAPICPNGFDHFSLGIVVPVQAMIRENRKTMYVKMGHLEQVSREMCRASHFRTFPMNASRAVSNSYLSESEFEATKFEQN